MKHPFVTFGDALSWARKYAKEHCYPFQTWRVVRHGKGYAVAVYSRNTGSFDGFALP